MRHDRSIVAVVVISVIGGCGRLTGRGSPDAGQADLSVGRDATMVCQPGEPPSCDGDFAVRTCSADGSGYDSIACPEGASCQNGQCLCMPGTTICQGPQVMKCGADQAYHPDHTCPTASTCMGGVCTDARCADEVTSTNPFALPVEGWPRFRHDNRNSGATPAMVADMPALVWKTFVGGTMLNNQVGLASGPVVNQDNIIFIGAGDLDQRGGSFYSFDGTGRSLYVFAAMRGYGLSTPAVRLDGTAYFSTTNSQLFAVDMQGHQSWSYTVGQQADSDPIVTRDGILIYSSDDGSLYALDAMGNLMWKSNATTGPGEVDGGLAETCDGHILAGGKNGWTALDAATGMTLWQVAATGTYAALVSSPLVTADGTMYGFDSGGIGYAIKPGGVVQWQQSFGPSGGGSSPAYAAGILYVVLNDGALHAIDAMTGVQQWSRPVGNGAPLYMSAGPITDGRQRVYFNSPDGYVYAFDNTGNQLWRIAASGTPANMVWNGTMAIGKDGTLYVPGNDGQLYALR
jgi:outer membrane protein assembly factor BamB